MKKFFEEDKDKAEDLGFPCEIYSKPEHYKFYADTCVKFWEYAVEKGIRTHNVTMKKAHLMQVRIPCSVLFVDECQDLDACQVDFIAKQKDYGEFASSSL